MEAIRKQASKLREQVARQQQAILRQLGQLNKQMHMVDEAELQCHQQLKNLYSSTKAAKHFQRNIVHGIEGFTSICSKQIEIVKRFAEDCCRYGNEHQGTGYPLARAALHVGNLYNLMENEEKALLGILGEEVVQPLRAQIKGAPLEDARHLAHRYEKLRQEVEAQAAEVLRRRSKLRDSSTSAESSTRLYIAEERLSELKSAMTAIGKEATAAMLAVEDQQQQITFQRIFTMVGAERSYHQDALVMLDRLYDELILETQSKEYSSLPVQRDAHHPAHEETNSNGLDNHRKISQTGCYFVAKVIHPFDAQAEGELSLSIDDYVVVRQVSSNGWSEGECKGNAGWFPSAYVEKQEKIPASKMLEIS